MPGRGSYGPAGKWIHDRANHIMGKNPEMPKGMAYAVATQQAHKVGKSPKGFRTSHGVREARRKHSMPKKFYKKTASDARFNEALRRLKQLQKEAREEGPPPPRRRPDFEMPRREQRRVRRNPMRVPRGYEAVPRGDFERRILGPNSTPYKLRRSGPGFFERKADDLIYALSDRLAEGPRNKYITPEDLDFRPPPMSSAIPSGLDEAAEAASPLIKSPLARSALKWGGLGAAAAGAGALAHQGAHAVGITDRGPADVLADAVVRDSKYSYDRKATERLIEETMPYIPRYYLEKAAAQMAGAVEDNEDVMSEGEPGMHGPDASVIPRQMLETVVPVRQHADRWDKETDQYLSKMFDAYKKTEDESIGRYTRGETEIPLEDQNSAGRLNI